MTYELEEDNGGEVYEVDNLYVSTQCDFDKILNQLSMLKKWI